MSTKPTSDIQTIVPDDSESIDSVVRRAYKWGLFIENKVYANFHGIALEIDPNLSPNEVYTKNNIARKPVLDENLERLTYVENDDDGPVSIRDQISNATAMATEHNAVVHFSFNGIAMCASPYIAPKQLQDTYNNLYDLKRNKSVL